MRLLVSSSSRERSRAGSSAADSQAGSSVCRTGRVTGETVERSRAGSSAADSQAGSSACRTGRVTGETVGVQQQQGALQGRVQHRRQPDRVLSLSDRESHW